MNDGQLANLLLEHNPWWTMPNRWQQNDSDLSAAQDAPYAYNPQVLANIHPPGLYVLLGPRRVGKSVTIKQSISQLLKSGVSPRSIFFCPCEGLSAQDLRRLITVGQNLARSVEGHRYWFLDEITAIIDGWSAIVKTLRDQNQEFRNSCVILAGSSAADLQTATKDLADRQGGIEDSERLLLPMTFHNFCTYVGNPHLPKMEPIRPQVLLTKKVKHTLNELYPWSAELDKLWQLFLLIGGFPRAVSSYLQDGIVAGGFSKGIWKTVRGDAIRLQESEEAQTQLFMSRLARNLASPINATKLAQDVGLRDNARVNMRIDRLAANFMAWPCYQMVNSIPNPAAQKKLYFTDPIFAHLAHTKNQHLFQPTMSQLTEQQVGLALARAVLGDSETFLGGGVMYERTRTGAEIDFVGPRLGIPFECKYADGPWRREARTMINRHGEGVIVTRSVFDLEGPVRALPVALTVWLLGT